MGEILYEPFKTVPLHQFRVELKFEFPDLPEALFDYAIIRAARTIAKDGNVIRRRIIVRPYPNAENYKLVSPDGLEVCSVLGIWYDSCCFEGPVRRSFVPPARACVCPREYAWYDDIDDELHITGRCGSQGVYYILVSVCPPDTACDLPAIYYDDFDDLLLLGAKSRILRMHKKPWSNLQLAAMYEKGFTEGIAAAAVEALTKKQRGVIKTQWGKIL